MISRRGEEMFFRLKLNKLPGAFLGQSKLFRIVSVNEHFLRI